MRGGMDIAVVVEPTGVLLESLATESVSCERYQLSLEVASGCQLRR